MLLKDITVKMKTFYVGTGLSSLSHQVFQFILLCKHFAFLVLFSTPHPNSERQVIIYTPAKCLVKSQGKTELTCVELNLKIPDGTLLQPLTTCQVAFPTLPLLAGHVPWSPGMLCARPSSRLLTAASEGSQSSSSSFCHSQQEKKYNNSLTKICICFVPR